MLNLLKCPFCDKEIESDSYYCDQCGEMLNKCSFGHGFKKGKVCNECGKPLVPAKDEGANATNPPVQQQPTSVNQPTSQSTIIPPAPHVHSQSAAEPEKTVRPTAQVKLASRMVSKVLNAELALRDGAIIGRRNGDYISVFGAQGYVSGTHARIQKNSKGVWEIVDLDSSNGTFLNKTRIAANQPVEFSVGDTISFYDLDFIVE